MQRPGNSFRNIIELNNDQLEVTNIRKQIDFVLDDIKCFFIRLGLFYSLVDRMTVEVTL